MRVLFGTLHLHVQNLCQFQSQITLFRIVKKNGEIRRHHMCLILKPFPKHNTEVGNSPNRYSVKFFHVNQSIDHNDRYIFCDITAMLFFLILN